MCADGSGLHPAAHTEQSTLSPSAQRGWIGGARRILTVRCGLLHGVASRDRFAGLLSATQAEMPCRCQPLGQDRKRLAAWTTDSASCPNAFVPVVVGLAESPSMADDRVVPADRALPRQQAQWDHPGSTLSFASGSAIKRITAGVKARR